MRRTVSKRRLPGRQTGIGSPAKSVRQFTKTELKNILDVDGYAGFFLEARRQDCREQGVSAHFDEVVAGGNRLHAQELNPDRSQER